MKTPLVSVPGENLGWSGGDTYLANLKLALSELENEGKIRLLPLHGDWLHERYPFRPVAKQANVYDVKRNLENVAFLPWAPIRRLTRPLIWIPDVQDKDLPEMFNWKELKSRDFSRRIAISRGARFYFSSHEMEERFLKIYPKAISVGIVRFTFKNSLTVNMNTTKEFGLRNDFFYTPNQFWKHKNHRILLQAYKKYRDTGGTKELVLSGNTRDHRWPEYSNDISLLASETLGVHSLGFIPRNSQLELYLTSSALIQPSLYEGWSSSVEEALNFGLPIISSDIPVLREQIGSMESVQFFNPRDSDALTKLMHLTPSLAIKRNKKVACARWGQFKSDLYQMVVNYLS